MTTKLVYLKTGEYVITTLLEARDITGDNKILCYLFKKPKQLLWEGSPSTQDKQSIEVKVSLITWPQFTKSTDVEVYPDALITGPVDPTDELLKIYEDSLNG